jgi:hypothetical protein
MLNGLLTLRGAWDKVREEPVLKFMVVAVTAYGMSTLEGPLLSIKSVNALSHFTDWTIAHVHTGALGWNGFLTFGMLYWLMPRLYNTKLYSKKLANYHFWIGLLGMMFYVVPIYLGGRHAGPDVEAVHPGRLPAVQELPGNRAADRCAASWCTTCGRRWPAASSSPEEAQAPALEKTRDGRAQRSLAPLDRAPPHPDARAEPGGGGHRRPRGDDPTFLVRSNMPTITA